MDRVSYLQMSKIRLGFIGVGAMGQCAHLRNYLTHSDCEIVALAELRPELGKKVAQRYGIPRVYTTHHELLDNETVDGLVAIQQYSTHGQVLPDLFAYNVPIIVEKPLARSMEVGQSIIASLAKSKSRLFVAYHKRSDPATLFARNQIKAWQASGEMGAMRYIRITMPPGSWDVSGFSTLITTDEPYPDLPRDPAPSKMDEPTAKALDTFVNYYIHQINLMRHLLGEDYSLSYADPQRIVLIGHSATGVPVNLEMQPYRTTLDWQETALIAFEKGWIKLELPAPLAIDRPGQVTVFIDTAQGQAPITIQPQLPWVHAMRQQASHFLKAIRNEPTPLCEAAEALVDLQLAEQYIEALRRYSR